MKFEISSQLTIFNRPPGTFSSVFDRLSPFFAGSRKYSFGFVPPVGIAPPCSVIVFRCMTTPPGWVAQSVY